MRHVDVVNSWKGGAGFAFDVLPAGELEDLHSFAVITPDLGNTKMCIDREFAQGSTRYVDFYNQVRGRVHGGVDVASAAHPLRGLNVEGRIRFEAALQILPLESRRPEVSNVHVQFFCENF